VTFTPPGSKSLTNRALVLAALADGICDAAGAIVLERKRPARQQNRDWIARQQRKVVQGVKEIARDLGERHWCSGDGYSLADIAVGCALGYLDLRFADLGWRKRCETLGRWYDAFAKRPSMEATKPPAA